MARKCEEDIVPETKPNFGECKSSGNSSSSNSSSNGSSGNGGATTAKAVVGAGAASAAALLQKVAAADRILGAVSPKLDDDADDILSMSLNKIDSPPPPRSVSRTKGGGATVGSNSNSSSSSSSAGGVEDLVRRKSNALSKVQSKSDSPLDGASVGSGSGGGGGAAPGGGAGKSSSAGGADMDGVDLCSTDEVKVFKDEGDRDDEKMSVEHNLLEEKSSLIDFTENEGKLLKAQNPRYHVSAEDPHPARSKIPIEDKRGEATLSSVLASHHAAAAAANPFNIGYPFVSPYPTYSNGDPISMPMGNKIGIPPFFCYTTNSGEPSHSLSVATHHLTTPPPAHCGIPSYQLDAKGIAGLSGRGSLYAFGPPNPHQYHPSPYAMLGADLGNNWHAPSVYSSVVAAAASAGFRNSSYPPPPPDFSSFRFSQLISPQSQAAAASIASSVANHSAHHGYVGQFPHQLPPSYSLAGLTTPSSPSLVNSGPKHSVSTSSSKSNKYFPSIPSLGDQGSSQSPTGGPQSKNGGGSSSERSKEAKMMSSSGSPFGGRDSSGMKGSKQQHVLDNTSIGLQGLSKVEVGADLSSSGANRLSSALLYQPYDAISKELGGGGGLGPGGCHPGDKGSHSMSGGGPGGLLGSSGGPGSMMSDDQSRDSAGQQQQHHQSRRPTKQKPHIKKPLNAFMLYMKDMRANVVAECTLKESAAINQILGRRWHSLSREEQSKYYEKARMERQLHMELYPGWSARDNYGYGSKKKKRKKDRGSPSDISSGNNMKKCRARYGLDQQNQWCKPCRRKKKCIKYMEMLMMSGGGNGGGSLSGTMSPDFGNEFDNHNDDDEDDDDDGSGDDSDEHMDDMDDDMMPPSNEMGGGGAGGGSGVGGGNSGGPNGGPSSFLMQGPRSNDPEQQADKIFGNPAAQACAVGVATIKQERDYGKAYDDQPSMHPGGSVAAYNAMLTGQMLADHHNAHLHHHNSMLHPSHMLNGGGNGSSTSNPSSPASSLLHQQQQQQQQQQNQGSNSNGSSSNHNHHSATTTTVGPHSQEDKHGIHMYPFQSKHQAAVCFPPSPAASSSSSLNAPLSNNPKMNNSHSLWLASSPMLMTPATLSGSDQSPQRQTPEDTKTKNGGMYGDHHGPSSVEPMPQQQKKKKRRRKRKHSKGVAAARNGSSGGGSNGGGGGGASGMSKSIQHILLRAIFEGNSGQVTNGDKENVIEFIEHFFRTRHSNHRMRQLIQARMNSSAGADRGHHNNKGSRHSDSDGGETDSSSCTDEDEEIVGCPRSSSKLPFTISSIIG